MNKQTEQIEQLRQETAGLSTADFLSAVWKHFGVENIALASSMSAEDMVITHLLCELCLAGKPRIFTLDTGRLPQATYDVIEETHRKYGLWIKMLLPDTQALEQMLSQAGPNLFYDSVEARKRCCDVRKVQPLRRELATLIAWVTGLRKTQGVTRGEVERVEWDQVNGLIKINPLANWSDDDVWRFIRENSVPYNKLHDEGYPSIGCEPCTRAVAAGEDIRAGRWWWERPEHKECGLHLADKKPVKRKAGQDGSA